MADFKRLQSVLADRFNGAATVTDALEQIAERLERVEKELGLPPLEKTKKTKAAAKAKNKKDDDGFTSPYGYKGSF